MTDHPLTINARPILIHPATGAWKPPSPLRTPSAPKLGRLQRMAEAAIRDAGANGLTADELAARLGMDRWSIQPRTSELRARALSETAGSAGRMRPANRRLSGLPRLQTLSAHDARGHVEASGR